MVHGIHCTVYSKLSALTLGPIQVHQRTQITPAVILPDLWHQGQEGSGHHGGEWWTLHLHLHLHVHVYLHLYLHIHLWVQRHVTCTFTLIYTYTFTCKCKDLCKDMLPPPAPAPTTDPATPPVSAPQLALAPAGGPCHHGGGWSCSDPAKPQLPPLAHYPALSLPAQGLGVSRGG